MMHYYVQRGHSIRELVNLSTTEKLFFVASMILRGEEEEKPNE